MKNRSVVLMCVVLVGVGVLVGCGRSGDPSAPAPPDVPQGLIRVVLPEMDRPRSGASAVTTPVAKEQAEIIEILVIEESSTGAAPDPGDVPSITASVAVPADDAASGTASPIDISVSEGMYRVLVLVGTESGSSSCLLASGYSADTVVVTMDAVAVAPIHLTTVSHDISPPPPLVAGQEYQVTGSGHTNSPVLTLSAVETGPSYQMQTRLDSDSTYQPLPATITGGEWSFVYTEQAPLSAVTTGWRFSGPYLTYVDAETGAYAALDGRFSRKWRWLSCTIVGETSPLWQEVWKPLEVSAASTGVSVEITWQ